MTGDALFWGWVAFSVVVTLAGIVGAIIMTVDRALEIEAERERELDEGWVL